MNEPTDSGPTDPEPYVVITTGRVREGIGQLLARAVARHRGGQVAAALTELERRLAIYPQAGEPLKDLSVEGLQLWHYTVPPLVAVYVIDEARRQVTIAAPIRTLPNSGLDPERLTGP